MLVWKEEYLLGVPEIDEQHKHLFDLGNKIYGLLENYILPDKYDRIYEIITELSDYAVYHFKSEEDYMLKIKFPGYLQQKVDHDDFIDEISAIDLTKVDEDQDGAIRKLLDFVFGWILDHIIKGDLQIKDFIQTRGIQ